MPVDPVEALGLVYAAQTQAAPQLFGGWRLRVWLSNPPPGLPPQLPWDDVVFVDAGALTSGRASLVKLAALHRSHGGGMVEEQLYLPGIPGGGVLGLYLPAGERQRQALAYAVELAALLGIAASGSVAGRRLGEKLLLVRHGPLLQQLSQYFSKVYNVDRDVAEAALRYAGLDASTASRLVRDSLVCGSSSDVNLGLLVLRLLEEMARVAEKTKDSIAFAGIVENTSRSRVLVTSLLAELLQAAAAATGRGLDPNVAARLLSSLGNLALSRQPVPQQCWCAGAPVFDFRLLRDELAAPVYSTLTFRLRWSPSSGSPVPSLALLEAALAYSGALPDLLDSELLYSFRFLGACPPRGGCSFTTPRPRGAVAAWTLTALRDRLQSYRCHGDPDKLVKPVSRVLYSYLVPDEPPGCSQLARTLQGAGVQGLGPCDLVEAVQVAPAVRVEYMTPMAWGDMLELLGWVYWASRVTLYAYPAPLLVVDAASRITWPERVGLERLAESLARRRQPYSGFLRGWRTRTTVALPP